MPNKYDASLRNRVFRLTFDLVILCANEGKSTTTIKIKGVSIGCTCVYVDT